jgi:hypothetical protein
VLERIQASVGLLPEGASTQYGHYRDVSFGGVLCALPVLLSNGLLKHTQTCFGKLGGYYTTTQVLLLLAYMSLCRIRTIDQIQYHPPGELGKLLGLDRVPEVRCLRNKLNQLCKDREAPRQWAQLLGKHWMEADPSLAGSLYVDGHVRLYHGSQTKLPSRYVARQRLCLRGTTDYWVNDALGSPYFSVSRPLDQGMLEALESDIVPRLLREVPNQPTQEQLQAQQYLHRFVLLFDREGYSPTFFKKMWEEHRISCVTYHKYPKQPWPEERFVAMKVELPGGACETMHLAEMGTWLGNSKDGLWVREVRKLTTGGHQTSLVSTVYGREGHQDAAALFSRWCQENYFRYAMENFALDKLAGYGTDGEPEPKRDVVNPKYRSLETQRRKLQGRLNRLRAEYAKWALHPETNPVKEHTRQNRLSELVEEIEQIEHKLLQVQQDRKATPKHIPWEELPQQDKFEQLAPSRKQLADCIKMLAYRSETAMAHILREKLARKDDARPLLQELFRREADLKPDLDAKVLQVHVHPFANPRWNQAMSHLLEQLNNIKEEIPGCDLVIQYHLGTSQIDHVDESVGSGNLRPNQEV